MRRYLSLFVLALSAAVVALPANAAERPTDAQKEALRKECRRDFMQNCSGVEPGGLPALECLEQHMDSLSEDCQAAVKPVEAEMSN